MSGINTYDNMQPCPKCGRKTLPIVWSGTIAPSCNACGYQHKFMDDGRDGADYTQWDYNTWPYTWINDEKSQKKRIRDKFEKVLDKILEEL